MLCVSRDVVLGSIKNRVSHDGVLDGINNLARLARRRFRSYKKSRVSHVVLGSIKYLCVSRAVVSGSITSSRVSRRVVLCSIKNSRVSRDVVLGSIKSSRDVV